MNGSSFIAFYFALKYVNRQLNDVVNGFLCALMVRLACLEYKLILALALYHFAAASIGQVRFFLFLFFFLFL